MVLLFTLTVLFLGGSKVVGNNSTTSLLPRGDVTEEADDTTSVWSAGINTTEEPSQPSSQHFPALGKDSTTSVLPLRDVTEEADDTTSVWSAGINTTEEPGPPSQPNAPLFLGRVYTYWFYVVGIGCTVFSIVGIIGNMLSIIVLYSRAMWSSTSVFLIAMASFDLMYLIPIGFDNIYILLLMYSPHKVSLLYNIYFLRPLFPIIYSVTNFAHTASIYTVVCVSVERYIAICHPLKAASYCTISKAKKVTLVVVVVSVVYNIPRYMEMYWVWKWEPEINRTVLSMDISEMAHSSIYLSVYLVYVNAVFKFIIPAVSLLTLNTSMVRKIYHKKPSLNKQERKGTEKERFTAIVLAVFVVFMISLSAACLELVMYEVNSTVILEECSEICGYISGASQLAVAINSAINFILFCFFGKKFRKVFAIKVMSCRRRYSIAANASVTLATES